MNNFNRRRRCLSPCPCVAFIALAGPRRFCSCFAAGPGRRYLVAGWHRRLVGGDGLERRAADSGTKADIYNGGTATITTNGDACSNLYLGNNAGSGNVQMLGGSLTVATLGSEYIGYSGTGNFTQSGGTNSRHLSLPRAEHPAAAGPTASAAGLLSAGSRLRRLLRHGKSSRSPAATNTIRIGSKSAAARATASAVPACCPRGAEYVRPLGTGSFTQSGGTNAVSSTFPRQQLRQQRNLHPQRRPAFGAE